jgi:hypothetical protein
LADGVPVTSVRNLLADAADDWFADPWGYPEVQAADGRARSTHPVTLPAQMLVPKTPAAAWTVPLSESAYPGTVSGAMRTAWFLLPADRLRYQAAVDGLARFLRPVRQAPGFGWRAGRSRQQPGRYRDQRSEWAECLRLLRAHADRFAHLAFLDIADFFASIRPGLLIQALEPVRGVRGEDGRRLGANLAADLAANLGADLDELFEAFFSHRLAYPGLPQNHQPSSVLANSYLDAALAGLEVPSGQAAVVRWMDDLWVFGETAAAVDRVSRQVAASLGAWGLRLNEAKTQIHQGREVGAAVEATDVHAYDRYRAYQTAASRMSCERADEEWRRISLHADPRAADSLRARLLYGHACRDHRRHADLLPQLAEIVTDREAAPARFQPAAWWLARREPQTARALLTAALPDLTDPILVRACVLAALDAGAEPRELLRRGRQAPLHPLLARLLGHTDAQTVRFGGSSSVSAGVGADSSSSGQGVADAAQAA